MLVEDDADIRSSLAEILASASYVVSAAANGQKALDLLRAAAPPDLILLDLMMPVMNGWEFRVAQRSDSIFARIPVIALSADRSPEALAIDADAYLAKPVDIETLLGTVERVLGEIEAARMAASDRLAALGTLAAGIAHEVNNPLTYVIANLQVLAERLPAPGEGPRDPELDELIADALAGAEKIRQIVSRVQAASVAQRPDDPGQVDLRAAVVAALSMLDNELRHRARVQVAFSAAPVVHGDRVRLEQVFINLLSNAAHAVGERDAEHQEIRVFLRTVGGRAVVEISDTGAGIPMDVRNRIFHPFFTTKPVGVGTGLGLAVCRGIVEALGGEITFESEVGKGSTFRVSLPVIAEIDVDPELRARVDAAAAAAGSAGRAFAGPPPLGSPSAAAASPSASAFVAPSAAAHLSGPAPGPRRRCHILVIDDEPAVLQSLQQLLGPEDRITTAATAREALELFRSPAAGGAREAPSFDVILCDLMMPHMSGIDLFELVERSRPELAARWVFMSGGTFTDRGREIAARGRPPLLDKPIERTALRAAIDRCLETRDA